MLQHKMRVLSGIVALGDLQAFRVSSLDALIYAAAGS